MRVSKGLCAALSLCLGQDEGFLSSVCQGGDTISLLRVFHYLSPSSHPLGEGPHVLGSSPHTDWYRHTPITPQHNTAWHSFTREECFTLCPSLCLCVAGAS